MILVVGKENCSSCEEVKSYLDINNIEYVYQQLETLPMEEQNRLKKEAIKSKIMSFPLVIQDGEYISFATLKDNSTLKIVKRNGKKVDFDGDRIITAINNAMFELGDINEDISKIIAREIESEISNNTTVEEIQDLVEAKLKKCNKIDVFKRYSNYRITKAKERERKSFIQTNEIQLLTDEFISKYKHIQPPMTQLGAFVYYRTYSRWLPELKRREHWYETVRRAVEYNCGLSKTTKEEAEKLYDNIFYLRQFLSGRTLFTGGTKVSKNYSLSNFNCALRLINNLEAFGEVFYVLMLGTGVGVRVLPEDVEQILPIRKDIEIIHKEYKGLKKRKRAENTSLITKNNNAKIIVGDSKEGWMEALNTYFRVLSSNTYNNIHTIIIDYDNVRPKGTRLKTFGGRASGYESIKTMFTKINKVIQNFPSGEPTIKLRPIDALDICNIVGENVVSGGVRRTSETGGFDINDKEIFNAKTDLYKLVDGKWVENSDISYRKMSNNSIFYKEKPTREQLHKHLKILRYNGEPTFINAEEGMRRRKDFKFFNPCGEILLDDMQTCNLTTINVMSFVKEGTLNLTSLLEAQKLSARAGYRMTCTKLELPRWDEKQKRDRLLGLSLTGWQDMVNATKMSREEEKHILSELRRVAHESSEGIAHEIGGNIPLLSTTVKPEGTLSLLPTVSSGVHYSHSPYFIRRVRITSTDPLVKVCEELGYPMHPENGEEWETCNTKVIEFPVKAPLGKTKKEATAIEQLENYKMFMEYYVDHNVSITVTVKDNEWQEVEEWVWNNWDTIVGISFLPYSDSIYPLLPFEECSKEEYEKRMANMKPFNPNLIQKYEKDETEESTPEKDTECASGVCGVR